MRAVGSQLERCMIWHGNSPKRSWTLWRRTACNSALQASGCAHGHGIYVHNYLWTGVGRGSYSIAAVIAQPQCSSRLTISMNDAPRHFKSAL